MMDELGPDAMELLQAGRGAFRPKAADRERVLAALMPQVGTGGAGAPSPVAQGAGLGALAKWSLAVVGVGVVAGGWYLGATSAEPVSIPAQPPPEAPVVRPDYQVEERAPVEVAPSAPSSPEPANRALSPRAPADDYLDAEVAILSRAGAALRSGQPAAALKALDEHQRRFPSGVLSQERSAARVQALCALGRVDEGRAELSRLEKRAPRSPLTARARKACGAEPAPP